LYIKQYWRITQDAKMTKRKNNKKRKKYSFIISLSLKIFLKKSGDEHFNFLDEQLKKPSDYFD